MNVATIISVVSAVALIVAAIVAALQVRHAAQERAEQAAVELVRAMQGDAWLTSVGPISNLPSQPTLPLAIEDERAAHSVGIRLETLGYLVYRGSVPLRTAEDLVGGITVVAWDRLASWVEEGRRLSGNEKSYEWFQWLAEQIARDPDIRPPAYVAYRNWMDSSRSK